MSFSCVGVRWRRLAILASVAGVAATILGSTDAQAKRLHRGRHHAPAARSVYSPPFAAMIVDANTGRTMHAVAADELRHPASITKVMTLYLLFEQIERGNLALDTELQVSRHAASMSPSKLGLRPGETIDVEDSIKAIVTRSANDVAAAIAENIAGSEDGFAKRMTRKARQLGMKRTVYRNASGLPNPEQVTTARDLTILARAIQERFPKLYKYFQTRSFEYAGQVIGNHNRLLGRVEGVDGIKTGFTNASGFNLMTSARLDGRHVVGVVLGGRSGASRDNIMAGLIRTNLAHASATGKASVFAGLATEDDGEDSNTRVASADVEAADAEAPEGASEPNRARAASSDPTTTGSIGPANRQAEWPTNALAYAAPAGTAEPSPIPLPPVSPQKIDARLPFAPAVPRQIEPPARIELARVEAAPAKPVPLPPRSDVAQEAAPAKAAVTKAAVTKAALAKPGTVSAWVIQLAAVDAEDKALDLLDQAKSRSGRLLSRAEPFTEKVVRGSTTLYRARFSGFSEADSAQEACKALKRNGFACFATRS